MNRTMEDHTGPPGDDERFPEPGDSVDVEQVFSEVMRRMPVRPRSRVPACEACSEADASCLCECCGQELCRTCWGGGNVDFCEGCLGCGWDDERPVEDIEIAAGLLR